MFLLSSLTMLLNNWIEATDFSRVSMNS